MKPARGPERTCRFATSTTPRSTAIEQFPFPSILIGFDRLTSTGRATANIGSCLIRYPWPRRRTIRTPRSFRRGQIRPLVVRCPCHQVVTSAPVPSAAGPASAEGRGDYSAAPVAAQSVSASVLKRLVSQPGTSDSSTKAAAATPRYHTVVPRSPVRTEPAAKLYAMVPGNMHTRLTSV